MNFVRYIIINIRNFMRYHKALFILMIVSEILSTICLLFSFGLFQNTRQKSGMMTDSDRFFNFDVIQEEGNEMLYKNNIKDKIIQFRKFLGDDIDIYEKSMNIYYSVLSNSGTELIASSYYYEHSTNFTREELAKSKYICRLHEDYAEYVKQNTIELSGVEYRVKEIVGEEDISTGIVIPVEGIPENAELLWISFYLKEQPTKEKIDEINNMFTELFGASIPTLPKARILMDVQINNMFYLYAALITIIIVLNLSLYFKYIFSINKREMRIFKLCGATSKKIASIFIAETLIELTAGYVIGNAIFSFAAIKLISKGFRNFEKYYSPEVYINTFMIFISISLIIVSLITIPYIKKVLNTSDWRKSSE